MLSYTRESRSGSLPEAYGESILFLNELRIGSIVVVPKRNDSVPYPYPTGINVTAIDLPLMFVPPVM